MLMLIDVISSTADEQKFLACCFENGTITVVDVRESSTILSVSVRLCCFVSLFFLKKLFKLDISRLDFEL